MILCIDLDGSVAKLQDRMQIAGPCPDRNDNKAFDAWLDRLMDHSKLFGESPIKETVELIQRIALAKDVRVFYVSARHVKWTSLSYFWIKKHKLPDGPLFLRPDGCRETDGAFKESVFKEILDKYWIPGVSVVAIDDDQSGSTEAVYKNLGILHLKVTNEGRY